MVNGVDSLAAHDPRRLERVRKTKGVGHLQSWKQIIKMGPEIGRLLSDVMPGHICSLGDSASYLYFVRQC